MPCSYNPEVAGLNQVAEGRASNYQIVYVNLLAEATLAEGRKKEEENLKTEFQKRPAIND